MHSSHIFTQAQYINARVMIVEEREYGGGGGGWVQILHSRTLHLVSVDLECEL